MVSAPGRAWSRGYCRGVAGLGGAGAWPPAGLIWSPASLVSLLGLGTLGLTAGVWRRAGLIRSSVVLGHTVGAWVPVGLLLGLVVGHPVRERRACCRCRPGHQGPVKEDHVF